MLEHWIHALFELVEGKTAPAATSVFCLFGPRLSSRFVTDSRVGEILLDGHFLT